MNCLKCGKTVESVPEAVGAIVCADCFAEMHEEPVEEDYRLGALVVANDEVVKMDNGVIVERDSVNPERWLVFDSEWLGYTEGNLTGPGVHLLPGVMTGFRWYHEDDFVKVEGVEWDEEESKPKRIIEEIPVEE